MKTRTIVWALVRASLALASPKAYACGMTMVESLSYDATRESEAYIYFTPPVIEPRKDAASEAAVTIATKSLTRRFGLCYEDYLRRKPGARGEADFKVDVDTRGLVKRARLTNAARKVGDAAFVACLKAAALDMTIDNSGKAVGTAFTMSSSFLFTPPLTDEES